MQKPIWFLSCISIQDETEVASTARRLRNLHSFQYFPGESCAAFIVMAVTRRSGGRRRFKKVGGGAAWWLLFSMIVYLFKRFSAKSLHYKDMCVQTIINFLLHVVVWLEISVRQFLSERNQVRPEGETRLDFVYLNMFIYHLSFF